MASQEETKKQNQQGPKISNRLDLSILVNAKKMDLSFQELNELWFPDFLEFCDIYTGSKKEGVREATQADIDKFYA